MPIAAQQRYGRWTVLHRTDFSKQARWQLLCDCGNTKEVLASSLQGGRSLSCGCWRKECLRLLKTRHGEAGSLLYKVRQSMLRRCNNLTDQAFKNYGARGIRVCGAWSDFEVFKRDVGERPSPTQEAA